MAGNKHIDEITGVETTGHEWDGIKELNNPLPRWWLWTFYATHHLGDRLRDRLSGHPDGSRPHSKGLFGWSSRADVAAEMHGSRSRAAPRRRRCSQSPDVNAILANDELRTVRRSQAGAPPSRSTACSATAPARRALPAIPTSTTTTGSGAAQPDDIYLTLHHGIRHPGNDDTRVSEMPAFGRDGSSSLTRSRISAWFVRKLSGQEADAGSGGAGQAAVRRELRCLPWRTGRGPARTRRAAPYRRASGSTAASTTRSSHRSTHRKHGVMPAWGARLGDTTVKQLAVYVHSLGGGE